MAHQDLPACSLSRRDFIGVSATAFGALLAAPRLLRAAPGSQGDAVKEKIAIQSYSLRAFDLETALAHTSKLGVKYWEAFPQHLPITTVPAKLAEYRNKLDKSGVTLMAYGVVGFDGNETKAREIFDFAQALGLRSISADPAQDTATFDLLDKLVDEYKIAIAIHNHGPGARYNKVADVTKWVQDRHPLIGACVDTGHYLRSDEDPVAVIEELGPRVLGVHLKDVKTITSPEDKQKLLQELPQGRAGQLEREGKIFTILGEGDLNVVGVLRALREVGYDGNLSLEYEEQPQNPLSDIQLSLQNAQDAQAYLDDSEEGFVSLWDGKTFDNWKINERPESWKIENGEIVVNGNVSHLFYTGSLAPLKNFELKVDVMAHPNSNSGIYVCTEYQDSGFPLKGFETQVNNSYNRDPRKTGSLYGVVDQKSQMIPDNTWWTQHVIVNGPRIIVKVDGKVASDYTEPADFKSEGPFEHKIRPGTIAFQAHDPGSTVHFKNIRVKKLPD